MYPPSTAVLPPHQNHILDPLLPIRWQLHLLHCLTCGGPSIFLTQKFKNYDPHSISYIFQNLESLFMYDPIITQIHKRKKIQFFFNAILMTFSSNRPHKLWEVQLREWLDCATPHTLQMENVIHTHRQYCVKQKRAKWVKTEKLSKYKI